MLWILDVAVNADRATLLREAGFPVIEARNGSQALAQVTSQPTGVVVLDLHLPDLEGLEVCRRLRSGGVGFAGAILAVFPENADAAMRARALECGADVCFSSPVDSVELHAQVRALLRSRSAEPAHAPSGAVAADVTRRDVVEEITERKRAEAEVIQSQKTFLELVERAPFGIFIVDARFRIAHMNAGSRTGAFRNVRPVIGRDLAEAMRILWPEHVAVEVIDAFRRVLETGDPFYSPHFMNPRQDVEAVEAYDWQLHRVTLPDGQCGVVCYYLDSTRPREAEAALRESERRLALAAAGTRIGIFDWNVATGEVAATEQVVTALGLPPMPTPTTATATTLSQRYSYGQWAERVHPEDRSRVETALRRCHADRAPFDEDYRIVWSDGSVHWLGARGVFEYDGSGAAVRFLGIMIDISERKATEARLTYLASFPTNNPHPVAEADFEGHLRYANPATLTLFPDLAAQGAAHPWLADWQATVQELRDGRTPDQTSIRTVVVGERIYHQTRKVIGAEGVIRIYGLDITERLRAERALRESEARREAAQAVAAERQRLYDVLETLPVYVALLTPDYHVGFANRFFRERFGESNGKRCFEYLFDRTEPCEICGSYTVLKTGEPHRWPWTGPDNRDYDIHDFPFTDTDGSPLILEMGIDITDRNRAERELQTALETLAARATQLRALASELTLSEQRERKRLAKVLHDHLQQLLVAAKFRIAILTRSRDAVTKQASEEIERLLDASISASRSLTSELSPPILHEGGLAACLWWLARWMSSRHGLMVDLAIEEELPPLAEDVKVLLFESVRELLFNAVKHANVSVASVHACQDADTDIRITVSDNGAGFDPALLKKAGETGGGFGLFSIRERLDMLGGRMQIDSCPGQGSRFTLTAPLAQTAAQAPRVAAIPPQPTPGEQTTEIPAPASGVRIRVLLADDHAVTRKGLRQLLGEEPDIRIVGEATNGLEAVELAGGLHPDVLLMDVSMPRLNGVYATRAIHNAHPDIRIIGLSMFEDHERAQAMHDAGAVDYVTKSAPINDLIAAIRRATTLSPEHHHALADGRTDRA